MEKGRQYWHTINKRKVIIVASVICLIMILAAGTFAFFIDTETAYNVITTGTIDVVIKETTIDENGQEIPFPEEGIENVLPSAKVVKKVWVENLGTESIYVRASVKKQITPGELDDKYIVLVGLNTEDWTLVGDYYYYNQAVKAGEKTNLLFDGVMFDKSMPNEYQNCKVDVIVNVQVVQAKNNGDNVFAAKGWPSED